jgi:hypothetical protein
MMADGKLYRDGMLEVIGWPMAGQQGVRTRVAVLPGTVLSRFGARTRAEAASRFTVQVRENEHIELDPKHLQYINHGCEPNVFFDVDRGELVCVRAIAAGDELRYFYPSTEWSMVEPFACQCGSPRCLVHITGASALAPSLLAGYRVSAYVAGKLAAGHGLSV